MKGKKSRVELNEDAHNIKYLEAYHIFYICTYESLKTAARKKKKKSPKKMITFCKFPVDLHFLPIGKSTNTFNTFIPAMAWMYWNAYEIAHYFNCLEGVIKICTDTTFHALLSYLRDHTTT